MLVMLGIVMMEILHQDIILILVVNHLTSGPRSKNF